MHALSLGAMLYHVELFQSSVALTGTAANPILRYQYRKSVSNVQTLHKICGLAYAENKDLCKPPCHKQKQLICSAIQMEQLSRQSKADSAFVHNPGGPNSPVREHRLDPQLNSWQRQPFLPYLLCSRAERVLQKYLGNFLGSTASPEQSGSNAWQCGLANRQ